eukprot:3796964-Pleurochrysis_carterae.AAC.3
MGVPVQGKMSTVFLNRFDVSHCARWASEVYLLNRSLCTDTSVKWVLKLDTSCDYVYACDMCHLAE